MRLRVDFDWLRAGLETILQIMKLRRSVCRAHGYSAHPPSYNTSMTRPSKIQSHNQTIFSLVNITFHSLSFQLPSLPSQITFSLSHSFNPIPAGVLSKTRICWGSPCLMSKYDELHIIGKLLCSTLRICRKNCKFAKKIFFFYKFQLKVIMFAKKNVQKRIKYTFLKRP